MFGMFFSEEVFSFLSAYTEGRLCGQNWHIVGVPCWGVPFMRESYYVGSILRGPLFSENPVCV